MASRSSVRAGHAYILIEAIDKTSAVFKSIGNSLNNLSRRFLFAGQQAAILGGALSVPLTMATRSARDFSDEILYLQSVLNVSSTEMEPLIAKIKELGRTTSFTATEVAQAATHLAQGGFTSQQIQESMKAVLNMARGARMELGPAAEIMVDTLTIFGMEASRASEVADKFFIAAKNGTIDVADLAQSFSYTGQSAADMGFTLDETLSILSSMSLRMLKATKAGTSLNQFITSLASNITKVREKLGLEVFTEAGEPLPALKILKDFAAVIRGMPAAEKIPILQEIFNVRGMRTGMAITAGKAFEDIFASVAEMKTEFGIADRAARNMDSGIGGSLRRIASAFNGLSIEVGEAFDEIFQSFEKNFLPIIRGLSIWADKNEQVFRRVFRVVVGINAAAVALLAMGTALRVAAIGFYTLSSAIHAIQVPFRIFTSLASSAIGFVGELAKEVLMFPVRLVFGMATGLIGLANAALSIGSAIATFLAAVVAGIVSLPIFVALLAAILGAMVALTAATAALMLTVKKLMPAFGRMFEGTKGLLNSLVTFTGSAKTIMLGAWEGITEGMEAMWNDTVKIFSIAWKPFLAAMESGNIQKAFQIAMTALKTLWDVALLNLAIAWKKFTVQVEIAWIPVAEKIKQSIETILTSLNEIWQTLADFFSAVVESLPGGEMFTGLASDLKALAKSEMDVIRMQWNKPPSPEEQRRITEVENLAAEQINKMEDAIDALLTKLETDLGIKKEGALSGEIAALRASLKGTAPGFFGGRTPFSVPSTVDVTPEATTGLGDEITKGMAELPAAAEFGTIAALEAEFRNKQTTFLSSIADSSKKTAEGIASLTKTITDSSTVLAAV